MGGTSPCVSLAAPLFTYNYCGNQWAYVEGMKMKSYSSILIYILIYFIIYISYSILIYNQLRNKSGDHFPLYLQSYRYKVSLKLVLSLMFSEQWTEIRYQSWT